MIDVKKIFFVNLKELVHFGQKLPEPESSFLAKITSEMDQPNHIKLKNCPPNQILFIGPVKLLEVLHKNKKYWKYAGVFSFFFLFSQNFMLIIRVEERQLILRKRFFNLPMTRFKCFQCHIVPRSCLQVAKYILKWTTSEVVHLGKAKSRNY